MKILWFYYLDAYLELHILYCLTTVAGTYNTVYAVTHVVDSAKIGLFLFDIFKTVRPQLMNVHMF